MIKHFIPIALLGLSMVWFGSCESNKFKKTKNGLEYKIIKGKSSKKTKARVGDVLEIHYEDVVGDSVMLNSRKVNQNMPIPVEITQPTGKYGDMMEGLLLLAEGDSAVFRVSLDSLRKNVPEFPKWIKPGDKEEFRIKVVSIQTKEKAQQEMARKQEEQQQKMQADAAKQKEIDEQILKDYFAQNNISPTRTASGLYYVMQRPGSGETPEQGSEVTVNYTGRTLDGKTFDSNQDPKFNHTEPFKFTIGQGQVITGWDEGVSLMKKGGKAKFFIPSTLAYGPMSPSPDVPENGILIFDVEVLDIKSNPSK